LESTNAFPYPLGDCRHPSMILLLPWSNNAPWSKAFSPRRWQQRLSPGLGQAEFVGK
jgi:hypothetical protein